MNSLAGIAARFLEQDQDLAFSFAGAAGGFAVIGFSAHEAINAPFEVAVDLASQDSDIDLAALIDKPAVLGLHSKYQPVRYLHGIATEAERGDSGIRRTHYTLILRPVFTRLDHGSDSRIWQGKTVPEIAREVLAEYGVVDVEWRLEASYAPREFLTQYRETHRAFLERILTEEGIFYFFEHGPAGHKMIFTDAPLATPVIAAQPDLAYNPRPGGQSRGAWVGHFAQRQRLRSSHYTMNDYTFHNPPAEMKTQAVGQELAGLAGQYAVYDFPGRYKDPGSVGAAFTRHRIESVRVDATTGQGTTNALHLSPGFQFTLQGHDDAGANTRHRVLMVSHSGSQPAALEEDAGDGPTTYQASFVTQPGRLPYRPPLARKPLVDGPQIAIVTGPAGEEIYTDEHGRVKVWFPWDRRGAQNEHSSCWIRVSQNWAGGTWGSIAIPRIGHEVVVEFLEGDPDQPIITGRTYHATNKPPYPLPEHKTKMVIRSDTHKGKGFNELSFEDENDREKIYVHAEKDMEVHVENNRAKRIDRNQSESIGNNKSIEVGNNHHEVIGGNMTLMVGPNKLQSMVTSAFSKFTGALGDLTHKLGLPDALNMGEGNLIIGVAKNKAETVMLSSSEMVGAAKAVTVGGGMQVTVGGILNESIAIAAWQEVGSNKVTHVGEKYELIVGKSKLIMDRDGNITLEGVNVAIKGGRIDLN